MSLLSVVDSATADALDERIGDLESHLLSQWEALERGDDQARRDRAAARAAFDLAAQRRKDAKKLEDEARELWARERELRDEACRSAARADERRKAVTDLEAAIEDLDEATKAAQARAQKARETASKATAHAEEVVQKAQDTISSARNAEHLETRRRQPQVVVVQEEEEDDESKAFQRLQSTRCLTMSLAEAVGGWPRPSRSDRGGKKKDFLTELRRTALLDPTT